MSDPDEARAAAGARFRATAPTQRRQIDMRLWNLLSILPFAAACLVQPGAGDDLPDDPQARDIAEYDSLADSLQKHRKAFQDPIADEVWASQKRVYWLEYRSFDPTLASWQAGTELTYAFPTGTEGNYRASDSLVVTATRQGDAVIYRAYAANAPSSSRGEITMPAPTDEQRWWAYAVGGDTAYIVTTGAQTTIHRWVPGQQPVVEVVLEQIGVSVGIFLDLGVFGNRVLFIESGRLWSLDLSTRTAYWVGNKKEISGSVSADAAGMIWNAADGPYYLPHGTGPGGRALKAEIESSGYELNTTYRAIHHFVEDAVLYRGKAIYKGQSGLFAYDLATHEVTPLLLEPRSSSPRIVYKDPQILDDGTLFVTGLESESGSVGADGPVWALDTNALLK
jgi:hypothetical protein